MANVFALLGLMFLFPLSSFATQTTRSGDLFASETGYYEAEGLLAIYSLGEVSSPMIGASLGHEFFTNTLVGFRGLIPLQNDNNINVYSIQAYSRHYFHRQRAKAFGEINIGIGGASGKSTTFDDNAFFAGGFSLGAIYELQPNISIGGLVGADLSSAYINNSTNIIPKIAMTSSFNF